MLASLGAGQREVKCEASSWHRPRGIGCWGVFGPCQCLWQRRQRLRAFGSQDFSKHGLLLVVGRANHQWSVCSYNVAYTMLLDVCLGQLCACELTHRLFCVPYFRRRSWMFRTILPSALTTSVISVAPMTMSGMSTLQQRFWPAGMSASGCKACSACVVAPSPCCCHGAAAPVHCHHPAA